ncbi:hypothetical protein [Parapedobacter tibetensis]|uniref:hypothetical protein n=1 Tax=Parapedobacter tibetensis TaxID=2972951 RepID=UPI00214D1A49|nr:hypothetical protein [Parapedobacter tibetensis]
MDGFVAVSYDEDKPYAVLDENNREISLFKYYSFHTEVLDGDREVTVLAEEISFNQ